MTRIQSSTLGVSAAGIHGLLTRKRPEAGGPSDPYWADVVFIGDMEGVDGEQDFSMNTSQFSHIQPTEFAGTARYRSLQSKFGATSLFTDGNGDRVRLPRQPDLSPGLRDFTIETWVRITGTAGEDFFFSSWAQNSHEYEYALGHNGTNFVFYGHNNGGSALIASSAFVSNQWYHYAVSRNGGTVRLFIDGVMEAKVTDWGSSELRCCVHDPSFGDNDDGFNDFDGFVDDFRFTVGTGRYDTDSNIALPTAYVLQTGPTFNAVPASVSAKYDGAGITNVTPEAMWGTINRISSYSGPAVRVINKTTDAEQDVNFDSNGFVTDPLPYGADTRIIKVYDQVGSDDLTCTKADDVRVIPSGKTYHTWLIDFQGVGGLTGTHAAESPDCRWSNSKDWLYTCGCIRKAAVGKHMLFGTPAVTNWVGHSLYHNWHDLHWRVQGGPRLNWTDADLFINPDKCGMRLERCIGDYSQKDNTGYPYLNGVSAGSLSSNHLDFATGQPITVGHGTWNGENDGPATFFMTELCIFSAPGNASPPEIATLDSALSEPNIV